MDNDGCAGVLLRHGADVTWADPTGDTALHKACLSGSIACTRLLLQHGASVSATHRFGMVPLDCLGRFNKAVPSEAQKKKQLVQLLQE